MRPNADIHDAQANRDRTGDGATADLVASDDIPRAGACSSDSSSSVGSATVMSCYFCRRDILETTG